MSVFRRQLAFTLIELLITVAVIGIVFAFAIPFYRSYIDTANMAKINSAYQTAIRYTREAMARNDTRMSMGLPSNLPTTTQGWIKLYDPTGGGQAPGGGAIYRVYGTISLSKATKIGAVVVASPNHNSWVDFWRPAYKDLKAQYVRVERTGDVVTKDL